MTSRHPIATLQARLPYLGLVGIVLLLDRVSKSVIHSRFDLGETLPVVNGFFDIIYVRNTGVAFGLFSSVSSPAKATLLSVFAASAAVIVVFYSIRNPVGHRLLQLSLALILGGALGNLYDRVMHGYVIDFLSFHLNVYHWPAFNVADTAISAGVIFLAAEIINDEITARAG